VRLKDKFKELDKKGKKAFIGYIPFAFPRGKSSANLILGLQEKVDIVEVGLPFSDPLADGPIIQEASQLALANGASAAGLFRTLRRIKSRLKVPVVILTYYNPLYQFGVRAFLRAAKQSGVSGIMVVDLPFEEEAVYLHEARRIGMDTISFITPTTTDARSRKILRACRGFVYYVSVAGITGPKRLMSTQIAAHIRKIKKMTKLPVCVGFGIHTRTQVREISRIADGVIVGSALVKNIMAHRHRRDFIARATKFLEGLGV